jgi:hypothetical protein
MTQALPKWAELNMITGAPGTGKSTLVDNIIFNSPFKNALIVLQYVDLCKSMEKGAAFSRYPYLDDIYKYAGGKVKICADDIDFEDLIQLIVEFFRDGIWSLDEAGLFKLTWKNPDNGRTEPIPPLKKLWKQRRKFNVETYLNYHEVSEMPVQIMGYANHFTLFHQSGEFRNKSAVPRYEEIVRMRNRIQAKYDAGNRYYSETIKLS